MFGSDQGKCWDGPSQCPGLGFSRMKGTVESFGFADSGLGFNPASNNPFQQLCTKSTCSQ